MSVTTYSTMDQAYIEALNALAAGKRPNEVIHKLLQDGIPRTLAEQVVAQAQRTKKAAFRKGGLRLMLAGIFMLVLGAVVTGLTYSFAVHGGTYIITIGLFLSGGVNLLRGFFRVLVG